LSNMHRVQWFDQQIREGNYPSSKQLAEKFEISRRQAQRDIEYLTVSLRAPLLYVAKRRGYCYEDKAYVLPHLYMTEEEKQILKYIAFRYRNYSRDNAKTVNRIAQLLDRMIDEEHTEPFGRLPVYEADPSFVQRFQLITAAIRQRTVVQIVYNENGFDSQLRIYPLRLGSQYATDYLIAYCESNSMERTFRLDAISRVLPTTEHFEPPSNEYEEWAAADKWAKKPFTARLELFQPVSGPSWYGFPIHHVADLVYEIEFYDAESFLQQLFVSEWKRLLGPKWLRTKLHRRCSGILETYGNGQET